MRENKTCLEQVMRGGDEFGIAAPKRVGNSKINFISTNVLETQQQQTDTQTYAQPDRHRQIQILQLQTYALCSFVTKVSGSLSQLSKSTSGLSGKKRVTWTREMVRQKITICHDAKTRSCGHHRSGTHNAELK